MQRSFTANIEAFRDKTADQMRRVFNESFEQVLDIAQTPTDKGGNMPVVTGFLRNSIALELNGSQLAQGGDAYGLAIGQAQIGDVIRASWDPRRVAAVTANYAPHVEFGTRGRPGRHFVGQAAAQWPQIVEANARRVR